MIRLDRVQRGLYAAVGGVASLTMWAHGEVPIEQASAGTMAVLEMTAGPTPVRQQMARGRLLVPASSVIVRVLSATVGKRLIVRLNGYDYRHDVVADETVGDIRDALMDAIEADEPGVTVSVAGSPGASFTITANSLGDLWELELVGGESDIDNDAPVFSGNGVLLSESDESLLVGVQTYSKTRSVHGGAVSLAQQIRDKLQSEDVIEGLTREGVAVWGVGGITDISAIAGARWESRATFDVTLAARSVFRRPCGQIETVAFTVS